MQYRIDGGIQPALRRRERTRYSRFEFRPDIGEKCGNPSKRRPKNAFNSAFADAGNGWKAVPMNLPLSSLDVEIGDIPADSERD